MDFYLPFPKCPTTPVATPAGSLYCCRLQWDDLPRLRREGRGGHGDLVLVPWWERDVTKGYQDMGEVTRGVYFWKI